MQTIFSEDDSLLPLHPETKEELAFIKAVSQSLIDINEGNMMDLDEAKRRLESLNS